MIQTKELVVRSLITAIAAIMITPSIAHAQSPAHAGDQFLQQQVSTIVDSKVFNDGQHSADVIIIHWDEDFNNLSLGHHGEVVPHNPHP